MAALVVKAKKPYRVTVKFQPPLSTVGQLRDVIKQTSTTYSLLAAMSSVGAVIVFVPPLPQDTKKIFLGSPWFPVKGGPKGAVSQAIITKLSVESTLKP